MSYYLEYKERTEESPNAYKITLRVPKTLRIDCEYKEYMKNKANCKYITKND